jgi:hypothetical protein
MKSEANIRGAGERGYCQNKPDIVLLHHGCFRLVRELYRRRQKILRPFLAPSVCVDLDQRLAIC